MAKHVVAMTINGKHISAEVDSRLLLVHFLREQQQLTGTHIGCDTSHCGVCTVDVDGKSVKSCTCLAVQCDGKTITTVEGLVKGGALHAVQVSFSQEHGLQCGFCTPGMLTRAYRFLQENPHPPRMKFALECPAIFAVALAIKTLSRPFCEPPK